MSRQTTPYQVDRLLGDLAKRRPIISEHSSGLDLFLDVEAIDDKSVEHAKTRLSEALMALADRGKVRTRNSDYGWN